MSQIERVMVIGVGWVGRQVAAKLASCGIHVGLVDRSTEVLQSGRQWIEQCGDAADPLNLRGPSSPTSSDLAAPKNLSSLTQTSWLSLISIIGNIDELEQETIAAWNPQLILECVPEQLTLKKRVLRRICELVPVDCIIASNSSYFVPSILSKFVSHPARFAHLHFHVPVLQNSVVDIVGCDGTNPEVLQQLNHLATRVGQYPLMLRREHPGYVFNWLLQAVLKAALELVAQDVVDAKDVDRSWKSVTGMQLGPFGMMDQIGLDVIDQVLSNARWSPQSSITDQQLLDIIRPLIQQGKLGIKSGSGFYEYFPN